MPVPVALHGGHIAEGEQGAELEHRNSAVTPAWKPFQWMLPPWRSEVEVAVEIALGRSGATPKQPIIGASGTR